VTEVQALSLVLVAAFGGATVAVRDPVRQAFTAGVFGLALALLFLVFQAPQVAMSQIVVGGAALPLMVLFALAKVGRRRQ